MKGKEPSPKTKLIRKLGGYGKYFEYLQAKASAGVRKNKKIGRNDKCYCGSGRKYKKCCMFK